MAHAQSDEIKQPRLGPVGWLRFAWTQLTSMSTAIFLLLLLAVAAVPGSIFPQRSIDASKVTQYKTDHPDTFPLLDKIQMFDVFSSVWFSAIYLLLFISLIGCVIPRARVHYRHWRSAPPRTPARLDRLPEHGLVSAPAADPTTAAEQAAALLKKRGYRVDVRPAQDGRPASIGAERGMLKELGNLLFHVSLIGVLVAVAIGGMFGYKGQRIIVEGETFVNTLISYDAFSPGSKFTADNLKPYSITLNKFTVQFDRDSQAHYGQPLAFDAQVTTKDANGTVSNRSLKVNEPLSFGQDSVYLVGNGYAPVITVKDGKGNISFQGPVVAVPQDKMYTSLFVLKVPDSSPSQLAFSGFLLPTTARNSQNVSFSADPDPFSPTLTINSYEGDLGLNTGKPQNIYVLDTSTLKELNNRKLGNGIVLKPNQTVTLPNGRGSITFTDLKRYIAVDVHHDPGQGLAFASAAVALLSLIASLFIARRRLWLTFAEGENGGLDIGYGLLARGEDPRLAHEAKAIRELLTKNFSAETDARA